MPISPLTQPASCSIPCVAPPPVAQLYNAPVPAGVDRLSSADNSLEGAHDAVDLLALTLEYDLGFATLTSASSWAHHLNHSTDDLTAVYTNFSFYQSIYGQDPRSFIIGRDELDDKPWSQELRLASKEGGFLDWVGGLFYKNQKTNIQEHEFEPGYLDFYNGCSAIYGQATATQVINNIPSYCGVGETAYTPGMTTYVDGIPIVKDQTYIGDFETSYNDLAAFGEVTAHLTSSVEPHRRRARCSSRPFRRRSRPGCCSTAARSSLRRRQSPTSRSAIPGARRYGRSIPPISSTRTIWCMRPGRRAFVAAASTRCRRPNPPFGYVTPPALYQLQPDTADNYEIGAKGTLLNRFRYSAAIYDIQWHNVQEGVQLTPLVLPASINVGEAFSRGVEFELYALLTQHLTAQVDYTYDQTKLTSAQSAVLVPQRGRAAGAGGQPVARNAEEQPGDRSRVRAYPARRRLTALCDQWSLPEFAVAGAVRDRADRGRLHHAGYAVELHPIALAGDAVRAQSDQQSGHQLLCGSCDLRQSRCRPWYRSRAPSASRLDTHSRSGEDRSTCG